MNQKIETGHAPRITKQDIIAQIVREDYFTAADGIKGANPYAIVHSRQKHMTICVLTMANGFVVQGMSACASPENFNAETGKHWAREDAIEKVWDALGYELRTKLSLIEQASPARSGPYPAAPNCPDMLDLQFRTYVGTQVVHAVPMLRGHYNRFRGWDCPVNEDPTDPGYLVRTSGRCTQNVPSMDGHVSWLPAYVFEKQFQTGVVLRETTFLERLSQEYTDLNTKQHKLTSFIGSDAFTNLPPDDQKDLVNQATAMDAYAEILERRLIRLTNGGM